MIVVNLRVFEVRYQRRRGRLIFVFRFAIFNLITLALWPNHNRYQYDISLIIQAVRVFLRVNWQVFASTIEPRRKAQVMPRPVLGQPTVETSFPGGVFLKFPQQG